MIVTKKYCDICKREVDWLYTMPKLAIAGLAVKIENGETELCENCAKKAIRLYNRTEFMDGDANDGK